MTIYSPDALFSRFGTSLLFHILTCIQIIWVQSPGWNYPLEENMVTHFSILVWRIPWTEEPGSWGHTASEMTEVTGWARIIHTYRWENHFVPCLLPPGGQSRRGLSHTCPLPEGQNTDQLVTQPWGLGDALPWACLLGPASAGSMYHTAEVLLGCIQIFLCCLFLF